jgi:hypothetical protein
LIAASDGGTAVRTGATTVRTGATTNYWFELTNQQGTGVLVLDDTAAN